MSQVQLQDKYLLTEIFPDYNELPSDVALPVNSYIIYALHNELAVQPVDGLPMYNPYIVEACHWKSSKQRVPPALAMMSDTVVAYVRAQKRFTKFEKAGVLALLSLGNMLRCACQCSEAEDRVVPPAAEDDLCRLRFVANFVKVIEKTKFEASTLPSSVAADISARYGVTSLDGQSEYWLRSHVGIPLPTLQGIAAAARGMVSVHQYLASKYPREDIIHCGQYV